MEIEQIKARIDLEELATRLGLERPSGSKNFRSPRHDDRSPSLSIYERGTKWKDHSTDEGGDCIQLVCYVQEVETAAAIQWLREAYGFQRPPRISTEPKREKTKAEYIADQCMAEPQRAVEYLHKSRCIPLATIERAIKARSVGYNAWTSTRVGTGELGYGGPAVALICRDLSTRQVMAVDLRFIDPALNGGVKTQSQGEKNGFPWCLDPATLLRARTIYVVESAINALAVEACQMPGVAALAVRGTGNVRNVDWSLFRGKQIICAMDADLPQADGKRPGPEAAWAIYDACTGLDISCLFVDQDAWYQAQVNDVADVLKLRQVDGLREWLRDLDVSAIQGLPGKDFIEGAKRRLYLPSHDLAVYWRFRVKPDFTTYVAKIEDADEGEQINFQDLAGFRIAGLSRVQIQSATATMSGEEDAQPNTVFAVSVQTARHEARLQRKVFTDERLHNVEHWKKFGPIFQQQKFSRLVTILERGAAIGARDAVNFVGLAWKHGKPAVIEGPDCYFAEPEKQCPYHNLTFPSGPVTDAAKVLTAYQTTFTHDAASLALVWSLGAHLKCYLGFWPHMMIQADKGAGKSTLIKRLERTIAFSMFGGQSLETQFRLLTSVSHTSHPVGWEEISARKQETINAAVTILQESYQFSVTRRGSEMLEFLQCAPVLLVGEDVPVRSLTGKLVRSDLSGRKGPPLPDNLPRFPVRQWLHWLAALGRDHVLELHRGWEAWVRKQCRADGKSDPGASRMCSNYACLALANALLRDFSGLEQGRAEFETNLITEMNNHIRETSTDREPWIWILETVLGDIDSKLYAFPFRVQTVDNADGDSELCLIVRPGHIMQHIAHSTRLRGLWDSLPVKSERVFGAQLQRAGVVIKKDWDGKIKQTRYQHMWCLGVRKLAKFGLHVSEPHGEQGHDDA